MQIKLLPRIFLLLISAVFLLNAPARGQAPCCNLLTNGDFEGTGGFTSSLQLSCNPAACQTGAYCVSNGFPNKCNLWPPFPDHTSGSGQYMAIDGHTTTPVNVWTTTVNVTAGTTYCFCFWVASIYNQPFDLGMMINGVNENTASISQSSIAWTQYCVNWTAPSTGAIPIAIRQLTPGAFRDFGIDDIEFGAPVTPAFVFNPDPTCGMNVSFFNQSTGPAPLTYMWSFGDPNSGGANMSMLQNPTHKFSDCGTYEVCLTVKRGNCTAVICAEVLVEDNDPPVAVCAGASVELGAGCTAQITPAMVDGGSFDNCYIASMTVSPSTITGCGLHLITLTVTDSCGNTSTCIAEVQGAENTPPSLTCPYTSPLVVNAVQPECKMVVNGIGLTTFSDNCGGVTVNYAITGATTAGGGGNASGTIFNQGVSTLTYTVTDNCGNTNTCSFNVVVTCEAENCTGCAGTPAGGNLVTNGSFTSGDAGFSSQLASSLSCSTGTYGVNTGMMAFCSSWPPLSANSAPRCLMLDGSSAAGNTILWQNQVNVTPGVNYCFSFYWASAIGNPPQSFPVEIVCLDAGNNIIGAAVGTQIIAGPPQWTNKQITFTAPAGMVAIAIRQLSGSIYRDWAIDDICLRTAPVPCTTSISVSTVNNCGLVQVSAITTGPQPVTYQWCDGTTGASNMLQLPCGPSTFCVTATCSDGSTATDAATFTVLDLMPPNAVCKTGVEVNLDANCSATITTAMIDNGSTDNCMIKMLAVNPSVVTGCGPHVITLTVTDWCDNTSTCTTTIQAKDITPPVIQCPPTTTVSVNPGVCYYQGAIPVATATDNCGVSGISYLWFVNNNFVDVTLNTQFSKGDNLIRCNVTDICGNTGLTCTYTLSVVDNQPPVIDCPENVNIVGTIDTQGVCKAIVTGLGATATDNCPMLAVNWKLAGATIGQGPGSPDGTQFMQGTTVVTYTAIDMAGNTTTCSFTVTVWCDEAPCSCPLDGASGPNLIANGNFSAGDTGFDNDLISGNCGAGFYGVNTNYNIFCTGGTNFMDHTTGTGNFLNIDGSNSQAADFWRTQVNLTANSDYCFSFWWGARFGLNIQSVPVWIEIVDANGTVVIPSPVLNLSTLTAFTWEPFNYNFNTAGFSGTYTIRIRQTSGSELRDIAIDDICFKIIPPVSTTETVQDNDFHLYPNPNSGSFTLAWKQPAASGMSVKVVDITGKTVMENKIETGSEQLQIHTDYLPGGLYFVQLISGGRILTTEKFVKM